MIVGARYIVGLHGGERVELELVRVIKKTRVEWWCVLVDHGRSQPHRRADAVALAARWAGKDAAAVEALLPRGEL